MKNGKKIFGTDGVRGRANFPPMSVEVALALGRAVGVLLRRNADKHRVVVGKDTRLSCYMYENALISGLCSMGIDTLMVGPYPTPAVAFITRAYRADAGVVISASHNPFYDNGIKFFSHEGIKFPQEWEKSVERLVAENNYEKFLPQDHEIGKNTKIHDADGRYIEYAKATFPRELSLKGLKVVLDCANGAGYKVAPCIFRELDAEIFAYGVNPDGLNINLHCGSLHPETVQTSVIDQCADVGIVFDGDADRVIMVDETGQVLAGDVLLAICARDLQQKGMLKRNAVVTTPMSNLGFHKAMESLGIEVLEAPVGDKYVIQRMREEGCHLGGESSGHIIFLEYNSTADGPLAALQILRIMVESGKRLSELAAFVQQYPHLCINVPVREKPPIEEIPHLKERIAAAQKKVGSEGKIFLRYSGTESVLRVTVEGDNEHIVEQVSHMLADTVRESIGMEMMQ